MFQKQVTKLSGLRPSLFRRGTLNTHRRQTWPKMTELLEPRSVQCRSFSEVLDYHRQRTCLGSRRRTKGMAAFHKSESLLKMFKQAEGKEQVPNLVDFQSNICSNRLALYLRGFLQDFRIMDGSRSNTFSFLCQSLFSCVFSIFHIFHSCKLVLFPAQMLCQ